MSHMKTLFVTGDTAPDLTGTCTSGTTPANLTGAALELHMQPPNGAAILTRTATIVDGTAGTWRYTWQTGELVVGTWAVELQVTYSGGKVQTFPADRPAYFSVRAQLA